MAWFNPYLNYHRPCGFATVQITARGQRKRRYRPDDYRTPYQKLLCLPRWEQFLKPGVTAALLAAHATRRSDTEAAPQRQRAKAAVLTRCQPQCSLNHLSPPAVPAPSRGSCSRARGLPPPCPAPPSPATHNCQRKENPMTLWVTTKNENSRAGGSF